jgi:hypothetical protein
MNDYQIVDPLGKVLSAVTPVAPRAEHTRQVLRACHTVLAEGRPPNRGLTAPVRLVDLMVAAAVALYVATSVAGAIQLLRGWSG